MKNLTFSLFQDRFQQAQSFIKKNKGWTLTGCIAAVITLTSCVSVNHVMIVPPAIKGAEFVGMADCTECHEQLVERFEFASHSRLVASGENSINFGCEACHGPGSVHSESGGVARTLVNPDTSPETCFQCHLDTKSSFNLPFKHSIHNGDVSCSDCHDPHEGNAISGGGMQLQTASQTCVTCHSAQNDHFVFRHEAKQDGCTVCHSPHGSVNDKMLKAANATLCLQCHFQQQTASGELLIGGRDHGNFLPRGTCWSAGCHEAVHGSNISSSLRY